MAVAAARALFAGALLAAALALGACGGDDEEPQTTPAVTATTETETETTPEPDTSPAETETVPEETVPEEEAETETAPSPEETPGGAGDEEPARTLALFTARNGRITPRVVRVPAFISIQIELRSADGGEYGLRFGELSVSAGGEINSASVTVDGLRPNERVVGVPTDAGNRVRVEATAEPGP